MRRFAAAGLALLIGSAGAFAQSGTPNPQDQSGKPPANAADKPNIVFVLFDAMG